jgi:predicted nucleic acid-binding protein
MPYLVDSDIMVDLTRGNSGAADYLDGLADAWSISMITCLELLAGNLAVCDPSTEPISDSRV